MPEESPTVECQVCGELVPLSSCKVVDGEPICADCQAAGRGIEGEVWVAPIHDWLALGGRS